MTWFRSGQLHQTQSSLRVGDPNASRHDRRQASAPRSRSRRAGLDAAADGADR